MKRVALFILLSLLLCAPALGQAKPGSQPPKCTLGLDQSPELRGFRMGMTQVKVLARLPGVTIEKPDKFGLTRLRLAFIDSSGLIKGSPRDKAVKPDITATPDDGSAFVID